MKTFKIIAIWDEEAEVWSVDESDIPGLVAWGATRKELIEKLEVLVPEMLELNGHLLDGDISKTVPLELIANYSKRFEVGNCAR
ncbi:MAG: DUF1902 domain-containing protein [Emcibacter sp.]|nr:DUF1902 domain-containing protein [Emcibacter sp.]